MYALLLHQPARHMFQRWDVKAIYAATDLASKPKDMNLRAFMAQTT